MDLSTDLEWWQGLVAGGAATVVMTAAMMMGTAMGMTRMNMGLILGSMLARRRSGAQVLGWPMHLMMGLVGIEMGHLVFGLTWALVFWALL